MKKNKQKKDTQIVPNLTKEEIKEKMRHIGTYDTHPYQVYREVWATLMKNIETMTEAEQKSLCENLAMINTFNANHVNLANTVNKNLQTSVVELTNDIIEQYNCTTTLEKSICEIIANSYWKIMEISKKLHNQINTDYISETQIHFISILSKELDRANRNYLNALNNLLEIKRPQMNIKIQTKNAYIGQNQQFNNNQHENENIKD